MSMPMQPAQPGTAPKPKRGAIIVGANVRPAAITMASFGAVLVVVQLVNMFTGYALVRYGIEPRTVHGLVGIVTAPFIHGSWAHLLANLIPVLILGFLVMAANIRQFIAVTVLIWLVSGLGVWLIGPSRTEVIGASALVFGWLAYLVARGAFTRSFGQIALGLLLLAFWGSMFWTGIISVALHNVVATVPISWQGHLFGAIGGVLAALLTAKADRPPRQQVAAS